MDEKIKNELQSAAFERLIQHLRDRKDVQNIDLMNLAGFCRNCLSKWYREEAQKKGIEISDPDAREHVYGCPTLSGKKNIKSKFRLVFNASLFKFIFIFFFSSNNSSLLL